MRIFNASPDFGAPMTEEETKNFLVNADKLNMYIGTIDERWEPNIHPVWYYYDNNNNIYLQTAKGSKKVKNIKKTNLVYYCIDQPSFPYKGVRGKAIVPISEDIHFNVSIAKKIMTKYIGSLDHPISQRLMTGIENGSSVVLELKPNSFSTWDYSKG